MGRNGLILVMAGAVLSGCQADALAQVGAQRDRWDCAYFGLPSGSTYEGTIYVCPADVAGDPRWDDLAAGPLPLPLDDAVRKSRERLLAFEPSEKRWRLQSVQLTQAVEGRWVYWVDWTVPESDKQIAYVVTLSGKVIAAELKR